MRVTLVFRATILGLVSLAVTNCWSQEDSLDLASALGGLRPVEPRLTWDFAYAPCRPAPRPNTLVPEPVCAVPTVSTRREIRRNLSAIRAAKRDAPEIRTPEKLRFQGIVELVTNRSGARAALAVSRLKEAVEKAPGNADLLNDLAASYIVRAQRQGEPYDLVRGLEAAERALTLDSSLLEARFNRALVLEKLSLTNVARSAWLEYRDLDPSEWGQEAERRAQSLGEARSVVLWQEGRSRLEQAALRGDESTVDTLVNQFRQESRELVQEEILPRWADAVNQPEEASRALRIARSIGAALMRHTSDEMIRDAVTAIEAASARPSDSRLDELVKGHRAYREGRLLYMDSKFERSEEPLGRAYTSLRKGGSPLERWPALFLAACDHFGGRYQDALARFEALESDSVTTTYPAFRGRLRYNLGITRATLGDLAGSLDAYRAALDDLRKTEEVENTAAVQHMVAESLELLGQTQESWKHRYRALAVLDRIPNLNRRGSILDEAADASLRQGYLATALTIQDELVVRARKAGGGHLLVQALIRRSDTRLRRSEVKEAERDLEEAEGERQVLSDAGLEAKYGAAIQLLRAESDASVSAALERVEEAMSYFRQTGERLLLVQGYRLRARFHAATGNTVAAEEDLAAGIEEVESRRAHIPDEDLRISYFGQSRALFDEMALLQIELRSRADHAFDILERARARALLDQLDFIPESISGDSKALAKSAHPVPWSELQPSLSQDMALVEYAILEDAVFAWIGTTRGLELVRLPVDRQTLDVRARSLLAALRGQDEASFRDSASVLYKALIQPLKTRLREIRTLVLIPDGPLYALPFASLLDSSSSRFLIEDFELSVAPSASVYTRCRMRASQLGSDPPVDVLVVGDPTFDSKAFPDLPPLPYAEREVEKIAGLYPVARRLGGLAATPEAFLRQARESTIVHFAGHAYVNDSYPLLSALLLASEGGQSGTGVLLARDLYDLYDQGFERTRLIVLAACFSARGGLARSEGAIGLARPFLATGIPAVVASLFEVEDEVTARLFVRFHQFLRNGENPAAALRSAQREALSSLDPQTRAPWSWAAFELIGGTGR